ncbi:MAG: nucleotidyltransferase domain-containing protein [Candidatus Pacearchaeota archaeon]
MQNKTSQTNDEEIPGMELDRKYDKKNILPENPTETKKEMEKTKKELDKFKNSIVKKYPFVQSLSILPPQTIKMFIDEEEVPKETEKYIHLYMILSEDKFKEIPKVKQEILGEIETLQKNMKQKIWLQIKTPVDVWEACLDSKFEISSAIAISFPLYDKGFLGALRVAEIHKSLVLQKFEKYVVSYVIGGSLVRGEAIPTSDVDVFIVINDTDVKQMPRLELKERLRGIIYKYIGEATALAGVKNELSPQIYLLTDFWESVKDAHPVIFTFIRDGIPIYDRHTFLPWKNLLRMGKLKPSPEAIDMFMKTADKTKEMIERRLIDAMIDVYYGVLTPSQALVMLYGLPPPTHKEAPILMKKIFVDKEKMLEKKYVNFLDKAVKMFKAYEHDPKYKVSGKQIDELVKESEEYIKRLKELREQIEKRSQEKTIEQTYKDVFELLKTIVGNKSQEKTIEDFEKNFVKKGQFSPQDLRILNDIVGARKEFKKGKLDSHKVDNARKNASILISDLIEYNQRCELVKKK